MLGTVIAAVVLALIVAGPYVVIPFLWHRIKAGEQIRHPHELKTQIDELAESLSRLRVSNRMEFSRVWKRLGGSKDEPTSADVQIQAANDDRFDQMLALQSTPPSKPQ